MKKTIWILTLAMGAGKLQATEPIRPFYTNEWDNDVPGFVKGKFYLSGGFGAVNLTNTMAKAIKGSLPPSWDAVTVGSKPIWFVKTEYAVGRHHGVGLTFAHNGFDVNVD